MYNGLEKGFQRRKIPLRLRKFFNRPEGVCHGEDECRLTRHWSEPLWASGPFACQQLRGRSVWVVRLQDVTQKVSNHIFGLAAFDLDGTLLRGPTVCEVLAEPLGRLNEMRVFEAFRSERELALAREEMAKWYCGHTITDLQQHLHRAQWATGAKDAVRRLHNAGVEVAILSVTWSFAVRWFAEQLDVSNYLGTELLPNSEIGHVWGRDKARFLREMVAKKQLNANRVAAIGDSTGDVEMLREANLRFFVGANPPPDIDAVIHLPAADIGEIASRILDEWAT